MTLYQWHILCQTFLMFLPETTITVIFLNFFFRDFFLPYISSTFINLNSTMRKHLPFIPIRLFYPMGYNTLPL